MHNTAGYLVVIIFVLATAGHIFAQAVPNDANASPATASRQAEEPGVVQPKQLPIHVVPYGPRATPPKTQRKPGGRLSNSGQVQYWGGPVISNVNVVEVLWGNFVDGPSTTGLEQFFTDITQSNYFDLLAEYSTVNLTGFGGSGGTNQTIGLGVFDAPRVTINPSLCPGSATNTLCTISDAQIQNEILNQLNAHHLPAPVQDGQGNFNILYMIYFPPGVTITLGQGVNSCQRGGFCAYHSNVLSSPMVPYGVFPDFSQGGCSLGCGSGSSAQNLTSASSHELAESVTDADAGTATAFAPPLAWADQLTGEEIGDFCAHDDTQVTVNSNTYTVQTLWSNMQNGCVSAPAHYQVTAATANAVPGVPFQVTVTAQASLGFQLTAYNNTVHFTSSDGAAAFPPDYTFVPNTDNGSHTFTVTLNTTGSQSVNATDTLISAMTGSGSVDIEHNPDLTVASSHSGNFKQGDIGDVYTLTASNIGDRPTTGSLVTVTENLPFGLTATAISGNGWNCPTSLPTFPLSCTRSDVVSANASYPPINLTVNVANFAPPTITNSVSVSGGGELNTSNDTGTDPTTVIQLPDLTISKTHLGSFSQGQLGETYTLTVGNFGFAPTSGLVTVVDQLPTGLTATATGGTGWSCTLGSLTCTRSDVLANGSSYPTITLTVNVAPNAPMPSVTNTATVSGGGEANTSNDTANDITTITVAASDLVIVSSHNGSFTQGQTGAAYTLTASNVGPLATSGAVTVTDNLPFAFTPVTIGGTGWTCSTPPTLNCTRSDALAGDTSGTISSYPPITLTVNVSATASTPLTNFAFVSGGGELDTGDDSSSDPTNVIQLPDLNVSSFHNGNFVQGQINASYNLSVGNIGSGPTVGTVTITDNLPAGLTATSLSGNGWNCTLSTLTCTRNDPLPAFTSYPLIDLLVMVATNAPSSVTNVVTVSGGGEINTSNDTASDPTTITPPLVFNVSTGSANIPAGGIATFLFGINSALPGNVTLACSGSPPGANCILTPSTTIQGNFGVTMTVTTTGPGLGSALPSSRDWKPPFDAFLLLLFGLAAMALALRHGRKHARLRLVTGLASFAVFLLLAGCGGGTPPPPPRVVTPPGTYTLTVTATNSTNVQTTATFTLIVH